MAKGKVKTPPKGTSSDICLKPAREKDTLQPVTCNNAAMFYLAAVALVVAICVAPLTAELFTCKCSELVASETTGAALRS